MARSLIASDDFSATLSNWTNIATWRGSISISGGALTGSGVAGIGSATIRWSGAGSFSNDQYCKITVSGLAFLTSSYVHAVLVRCGTGTYNTSTDNRSFYYAAIYNDGSGTYTTVVGKVVSGTNTVLASTFQAWVDGDTLEIEVEGTDLRVYRNGTEIATLASTDSDLSTGVPGLVLSGGGQGLTMDDFEGGNITGASPGQAFPPSLHSRIYATIVR